jgi:hypothetical protein
MNTSWTPAQAPSVSWDRPPPQPLATRHENCVYGSWDRPPPQPLTTRHEKCVYGSWDCRTPQTLTTRHESCTNASSRAASRALGSGTQAMLRSPDMARCFRLLNEPSWVRVDKGRPMQQEMFREVRLVCSRPMDPRNRRASWSLSSLMQGAVCVALSAGCSLKHDPGMQVQMSACLAHGKKALQLIISHPQKLIG